MKRFVSLLLAVLIMLSSIATLSAINIFAASGSISYSFTNTKAGYAQGTVTVKGDNGTYWLYWADNTKALSNYSEVASLTVSAGQGTFTMPKYTAIPADATKLIAIKSSSEPSEANRTVANASAVYSVPASKKLDSQLLYTFGAISDPQLDNQSTTRYPYDEVHLKAALETLASRKVDFTVSSGDTVNDQDGPKSYAQEYKTYQRILADSSYAAPIYEALGNHDVGSNWYTSSTNNNAPFIKATGLNGNKATINAGKPYFEVTEPTTGDHFIFMALEGGFYTNKNTQFSTAQLDWLEGLLKKYNGDGKNIFIIEHANIAGWGSGDKLTTPYYYDLGLVKTNPDVSRFIKLMETYKDCVIITGHTHLELSAQYNYSDNNGTSAVMIHNSAIGGVRYINSSGDVQREPAILGLSEGYIVEVYEDFVLFNGTNMYYNETMPQCSYIVPMSTSERDENDPLPTEPESDNVTITLKDETGEGWMSNNASEREIQLIDNDTNTKYVMTSYDGYKTWSVDVPRTVTDITFRRVRTSNGEIRNQWDAGERNGSLCYCVLDDAGGGTTEGNGYWDMSLREPTRPAVTEPEESSVVTTPTETTKVTTATVSTEPTKATTVTVATEPTESTLVTVATEPTETSTANTEGSSSASEPVSVSTNPSSTSTDPQETQKTQPSETATTQSNPTESVPDDIPFYGDADLNGKVNVKDATAVQKYTAKMLELEGIAFTQADVTGDGKVNIKDATSIQKYVAKIIAVFPVEEAELVSVGAIDPSTFGSFEKDLEDYYTFSSYDQYMALKKACIKYKNATYTDAVRAELQKLREALYDIAGEKPVEGGEITVYFENTKNWSKVNIYAWGTGENATWPGVAMTKLSDGTYSYTFNYDNFQNIIFNNGTEQTEDIAHPGKNYLEYYITGGPSNKYTVSYDQPIG
ncbi:MAG: starch-binding protein [Clostridia bacterium]|nr:starch-binding protein [Clostridia bacterium]